MRLVESHDGGARVAVLGPLEVTVTGTPVPIAGHCLRRLLVRLALARGEVVDDTVLLGAVWEDDAHLAVLHTAIARLRRQLEPGRPDHAPGRILVRIGTGYVLRLAHHGLDADRFVAAARRGAVLLDADRPAEARSALDLALAEWSGTALADARDRRFAGAEALRLEALRTDAEELRAIALVRAGDPAGIPTLESQTAAHPARERGWEVLARALCAAGRPADAADALGRARALLLESTGTDLPPALDGLRRAILRNDPGLLPPAGRSQRRLLPTTNVPAPLSSLVGRRAELTEVRERLRRARLVSLVGPGGVGKTRLAHEALRRRHDQDGPWLVELAEVRAPGLVAERAAHALGIGSGGCMGTLVEVLRDRSTLLLLDNCEQLVAEVGEVVTTLLASCPLLRVLTTGREPLSVAGEEVLHIAPLSSGVEGDAVRLFLARAAEVSPCPTTADALAEAAELCEDLDGLPLAIELAAARAGALSVRDLRAALADRFALLRRDGRTGRHATMLATVEWSYQLLDEDEQDVYQALAVFHGGFTLEAAQAVLGRPDTAVVLARLIARSLITRSSGGHRYRMLETVRQHAERVTSPDRLRVLQQRHLDWIRTLADHARSPVRGRLSSTTTDELHDEIANIRAALAVADVPTVLRIGGGFTWFWYREGLTAEGLGHLLPAIHASLADPGRVDLGDRCRAAMGVVLLASLRGDLDLARSGLDRAGADAAASGDLRAQAQYLSALGYLEAGGGAISAARAHAERSLVLARCSGDRGAAAESLMVLGEVARQAGRRAGHRGRTPG
jgi:predicted ATPase/DNA-binding SARP family transcriptional activator